MAAWLAPAISAGASALSSIFGGSAESIAAQRNWQINLLNYYQRAQEYNDQQYRATEATQDAKNERRLARADAIESRDYARNEAQEAKELALQDKKDARLGQTDQYGNRSYFKEGVGWVSELSPMMQALQDRYMKEEQQVLDNDLPKQRELLNANVNRQREEGDYADSLKWRMGAVGRRSASEVEAELNGASAQGIQEGFGSALEEAMRAALRTGSSNAGEVAAAIGRARSSELQKAFLGNKMNARNFADSEYANETGRIGQLYQQFAARASADPNVGYNPRNMAVAQGSDSGQSNALLNAFANTGNAGGRTLNVDSSGVANAMGNAIRAAGSQGARLEAYQPDNGLANAIGGVGGSIGAVFERMQQQQNLDQARDFAMKYRGNAGMF